MNRINTKGMKELFTFASFICLIFTFMIVTDLQGTSDLFLKIINIILLIVLGAGGIITAIKSAIDSSEMGAKFLIVINLAILLVYLILIFKVVYIFK